MVTSLNTSQQLRPTWRTKLYAFRGHIMVVKIIYISLCKPNRLGIGGWFEVQNGCVGLNLCRCGKRNVSLIGVNNVFLFSRKNSFWTRFLFKTVLLSFIIHLCEERGVLSLTQTVKRDTTFLGRKCVLLRWNIIIYYLLRYCYYYRLASNPFVVVWVRILKIIYF